MNAEIRYRYDEDLARRAVLRFLSRYFRMWLIGALLLVLGILVVLLRELYLVILFAAVLLAFLVRLVHTRRRAIALVRLLGSPEITVTADDEGISFRMPTHQTTSAWTSTREIWRFEDVWIFFAFGSASMAYTAVPTAAMSPEFQEIVIANMHKHGAKVR